MGLFRVIREGVWVIFVLFSGLHGIFYYMVRATSVSKIVIISMNFEDWPLSFFFSRVSTAPTAAFILPLLLLSPACKTWSAQKELWILPQKTQVLLETHPQQNDPCYPIKKKFFLIFYWSIVDLQCCVSFRCTAKIFLHLWTWPHKPQAFWKSCSKGRKAIEIRFWNVPLTLRMKKRKAEI